MKIQVVFYPDVSKSELDGTGTVSEIGWQRLHSFLEKAFELREGERLVGITVTEAGIKAKFERAAQELEYSPKK